MAIDDVVRDYCAAWNEVDSARRQALLQSAWSEDGVYCDPFGLAEGRSALGAHIGGFHEQFSAHRLRPTSGVEEHHGWLRFAWTIDTPDGGTLMDGFDVGQLADDGRLARIVGFFGSFPEAG